MGKTRRRTTAARPRRTREPLPSDPASPIARFDRSSIVADRPFGVAQDAVVAASLVIRAADLSRGVSARQPECHRLAPVARDALYRLYTGEIPRGRLEELRRFMRARYMEDCSGPSEDDSENAWDDRFDARDLRAPEPWTIDDLRGAAQDFLCVEAYAFFRDPSVRAECRLAASVAVGALAVIVPNGTTLAVLEAVAAAAPKSGDGASIAAHAWLSEIRTGTFGEDTVALAREGHRLLAEASAVAADLVPATGGLAVTSPATLQSPVTLGEDCESAIQPAASARLGSPPSRDQAPFRIELGVGGNVLAVNCSELRYENGDKYLRPVGLGTVPAELLLGFARKRRARWTTQCVKLNAALKVATNGAVTVVHRGGFGVALNVEIQIATNVEDLHRRLYRPKRRARRPVTTGGPQADQNSPQEQ